MIFIWNDETISAFPKPECGSLLYLNEELHHVPVRGQRLGLVGGYLIHFILHINFNFDFPFTEQTIFKHKVHLFILLKLGVVHCFSYLECDELIFNKFYLSSFSDPDLRGMRINLNLEFSAWQRLLTCQRTSFFLPY